MRLGHQELSHRSLHWQRESLLGETRARETTEGKFKAPEQCPGCQAQANATARSAASGAPLQAGARHGGRACASLD